MGMSMRVERSTVAQVKARLDMHKKKGIKRKELPEEPAETLQLEYNKTSNSENESETKEESEEKEEDEGLDSEAAAFMGFSGFGSSKP